MSERFFRAIGYHIRASERRILRELRDNPRGAWARIMHADMIRLSRVGLRRGMAIGMFWAFAPMPFQMIPAAFFCWLARANLPAAILCVWISNPFTYAPIFFAEYQIGALMADGGGIGWEEFARILAEGDNPLASVLHNIGAPLLYGALAMSTFMALCGYAAAELIFARLQKLRQKRRRRQHSENAHPH